MNVGIKQTNCPVWVGGWLSSRCANFHILRYEKRVYSLQYRTVYRMCHEVQKQNQITVTILHNISTSVNNTTGCPSDGHWMARSFEKRPERTHQRTNTHTSCSCPVNYNLSTVH